MDDLLYHALASGALCLTANRRLARALRQGYARRQEAQGATLWATPEILPWGAWLERCWDRWCDLGEAPRPRLLGADQQQLLWERVVAEATRDRPLLQAVGTARAALEAWRLMNGWGAQPQEAWLDEEGRAFLAWAEAYRQRCAAAGWLDPAQLPEALAPAFSGGALELPARLLLAGFDELTPQQLDLVALLRAAGCAVEEVAPPAREPRAWRLPCIDREAELRAAARWARALLEAGEERIGVVVHGLEGVRALVERLFREELTPGAHLPGRVAAEPPFNLSLGRPLAELPLVHDALLLLKLRLEGLTPGESGILLRSPYVGDARQEEGARAALDARLRRVGLLELTPARLERLATGRAEREEAHAAPRLRARLRALEGIELPRAATPSHWARLFAQLLDALGWPGDRPLDSAEYQGHQAWLGMLSRLAALDGVAGRHPAGTVAMGAGEALARLRRLCAEGLFQPESGEAPVQVLGMLEAGGLDFDHLWVAGLTDDAWPAPAAPNPFLPVYLQRQLGMPHASAARELAFARRLTERLMVAAPEVILSHPRREEDRELAPSPLIAALPEREMPAAPEAAFWGPWWAARAAERLDDRRGPPLEGGAPGGSGLLKAQAACPFQAFARYRLGAVALDEPLPGMDALDRGVVMHAALEQLWRALGGQARLLELDADQLDAELERAVGAALAELRAADLPESLPELERGRLTRRLREWLEIERERAPFTVEEAEGERTLAIGGLELTLRIDRIDRLASGGVMLIDYKTGEPSPGDWFGARPAEPQLPLYALALAEELEALAFAQLKVGKLCFKGVSRHALPAPGVTALADSRYGEEGVGWEAQLAAWRATLERLAAAARDGEAAVDPNEGGKACRHCDLGPLCRIHEANLWVEGGAMAEEEA